MTDKKESTGPSPFDVASLRAPQDFQRTGGVKRTTQRVRAGTRPPKDKFFRVHPIDSTYGKEEWCLNVLLFEYQFEGDLTAESFIVPYGTEAYTTLSEMNKLTAALIVLGVTRGGNRFLWELKLPNPNSNRRCNLWAETRLDCAKAGTEKWVKPVADNEAGCYQYDEPLAELPEPDFGADSFDRLMEIAYRDRIVTSLDHEAVRELMGS